MDSAGGSAVNARDKDTMAILPIFGKINNTEDFTIDKILASPKLMDMVNAIGAGIGEDFDIDKVRYHKIIPLADADADGLHIQCLYLTFFYRHMRPLIENGYVYLSVPPLFLIKTKSETIYAYTMKERDDIISNLTCKYEVNRMKGLGEMNADQLWDSTMNPETSKLIQITIDNIEQVEAMISTCMNEKMVASRKDFIMNSTEEFNLL